MTSNHMPQCAIDGTEEVKELSLHFSPKWNASTSHASQSPSMPSQWRQPQAILVRIVAVCADGVAHLSHCSSKAFFTAARRVPCMGQQSPGKPTEQQGRQEHTTCQQGKLGALTRACDEGRSIHTVRLSGSAAVRAAESVLFIAFY